MADHDLNDLLGRPEEYEGNDDAQGEIPELLREATDDILVEELPTANPTAIPTDVDMLGGLQEAMDHVLPA